jgi:alpha-mannosidase
MAILRSLLQRHGGGPRESVQLNPVAQIAVRYLAQYGSKTAADIEREVSAHRTIYSEELDEALTQLLASGLAETTLQLTAAQAETFYAPTKKARALRNRIPADPRTVTEFYL